MPNYYDKSVDKIVLLETSTRNKFMKFLDAAHAKGINLYVYETYRPLERQWELRKKYLTTGSPRAAKPGESWHNYYRAGDVVEILPNGKADWNYTNWETIKKLGRMAGLDSGESFGDKPHWQNPGRLSIESLKKTNPGWEKYHKLEQELKAGGASPQSSPGTITPPNVLRGILGITALALIGYGIYQATNR